MSKVLIAFSGGLDTSYCVKYLLDQGHEVHTALVDTGGFDEEELLSVAQKAKDLGSQSHQNLDQVQEYYSQIVKYLIFGNVLKNHTYPLSVSAERVNQAIALVHYAKEIGAEAIAHGSTGAGNDQVRFDLIFETLAPELEIITPIRDLSLSREEEVAFLKEKGVELPWEKAQYSVNKGLWGTSVGGKETLTSDQPLPDSAYPSQLQFNHEMQVELEFKGGEVVGINGQAYDPVTCIQRLNDIGSKYAIGRDIHVGDTIIGIKGRVGFEAAAAILIIKAHQALEKHVLSKWQLYWKDQMANWYGMMLHEGQYLDPVMRDIEAFLDNTQGRVEGKVFVQLKPFHFSIAGIESPYDLMQAKFGAYGEKNLAWSGEDVKGFTKVISTAGKIYHSLENGKA